MGKVLKSFEFTNQSRDKYPWDKWADGQIWQITKGQDFEVDIQAMRSMLHNRSRYHGMLLRTKIDGDTLTFQFVEKTKAK